MAKQLTARLDAGKAGLVGAIKHSLSQGALSSVQGAENYQDFQNALDVVGGTEGVSLKGHLGKMQASSFDAFKGSMNGASDRASAELREAFNDFTKVMGGEGFSMQNYGGSEQDIKATNMTLNAQTHRQTPAAEELFKTVSVRYEDEGAELIVRAAGLGTYVYGATAFQSASELRPIFGLLRTGEMFKDEVLALYPVFPADTKAPTRALFADPALVAPTDATYMPGDAYVRQDHQTQFLKVPVVVENLLALAQAPGQRPWTSTDEVESNSICARRLAVKGKVGGADVSFFINTSSMSNNTFGPTSQGQSSDERGLNLEIRELPAFSVTDKDGKEVGETLFKDFKDAGYEPMLNLTLSGKYQRQTNRTELLGGMVTIGGLKDIVTKKVIRRSTADGTQAPLFDKLEEGAIAAAKVTYNVSNTSRGNFGYRIEVYDAKKHLSVRRKSPVSVKYPISKDDVNQDSLDFAIQQMSVVINNQCSKDAFDAAFEHLDYITSINGAPVVGNAQGSNVLPGQHFVTAAAVNRDMKLEDTVSANGTVEVFAAVSTAIINEVSDITAALNTNSGLASISEYGGVDKLDWTVVVHQNLARFLMRQGDARTIGAWDTLKVVETNFDSMIGTILVVPRNTSNDDNINPLGGIGVNISKENVVVQGNVTRDQQDFGLLMTMPAYRHWALCPVIGSLNILDAKEFLGDEGLLSKLAKLRVSATGHLTLENAAPKP